VPPSPNPSPSVEQQRAEIQMQLALRPDDQYLQRALMRLTSPQHIKDAARQGIFFSYSSADELFAVQLAEDLRDAGSPVWLDIIDMPNDADWHLEIETALARCGLMVTILSPDALLDDDVKAENIYFLEQGKIVVPVIYVTCNYAGAGLWNQPVDFRHDYALGLTILSRLLSSQSVLANS
jgi:hypothetical protein